MAVDFATKARTNRRSLEKDYFSPELLRVRNTIKGRSRVWGRLGLNQEL